MPKCVRFHRRPGALPRAIGNTPCNGRIHRKLARGSVAMRVYSCNQSKASRIDQNWGDSPPFTLSIVRHVISARIILDPGSHAKEVGVEDPAEETFAARILYILSILGTGSQIS